MKNFFSVLILLSIGFFISVPGASAEGKRSKPPVKPPERPLKTEPALESDITGTVDVILYGGRYTDDPETVAVLDVVGDRYLLEPFSSESNYTVTERVPSADALKEANTFVRKHSAFWKHRLRKVVSETGEVIAYELKPLYMPVAFGTPETIDVYYWPEKKGRVRIIINPVPDLKKSIPSPGKGNPKIEHK